MWTPTGFWVLWLRLDSAHEDPCGGGGGVRDISVPQFGPSPCGLCGPPVSLSLEVTGFPHPRNLWCLRLMATAPSPCLSDLSVLTLPPSTSPRCGIIPCGSLHLSMLYKFVPSLNSDQITQFECTLCFLPRALTVIQPLRLS